MDHHAAASRASENDATSSIKANAPIKNHRLGQHIVVALIGAMAAYLFWLSRMEWDAEMRTWRAVGDAAFILLFVAMMIGPAARIWPRRLSFLLNWRRAFGIWFAIFASVHAFLVWDGWARWSIRDFLGYQELPVVGLSGSVLVEPGFGLANMVGLVALFFGLVGTVFMLQSTALVKVVLQRRRKGVLAHDGQNQ